VQRRAAKISAAFTVICDSKCSKAERQKQSEREAAAEN